jgi:LEA14-like dessication related protein
MKLITSTLLIGLITLASCSTANLKEPEYREIREVKLIELGVLQSKAGIDFVFYNPNNTGVQISDAHGDLYIDNQYVGRFELDEKVNVKKRSEFIVPAIIKVDMIGAIKNQRDLWKKKEALVRIDGMATVRKSGFSKQVPVKYENMENIERFRGLIAK